MAKEISLKGLKRKTDRIFSEYIRRRDKGICCTCFKQFDWKYEGDCGHYIDRTHLATRYDERNANFQCIGCNRFHKPHDEYAAFMLNKYSQKVINELRKQKYWTLVEFVNYWIHLDGFFALTSRQAYEYIIKHYQEKLRKLK